MILNKLIFLKENSHMVELYVVTATSVELESKV